MIGAPATTTLVERLRAHAASRPDRRLYTFLDDDGGEAATLTYAELDTRARALAAHLQARGGEGERALLLFPPGLAFIEALFGCLYAGVIAVPTPPPGSGRRLERLRPLLADARPRFVLAPAALLAGGGRRRLAEMPGLEGAEWIAPAELPEDLAGAWRDPGPAADTADAVAFLQYTSGSTSAPKGVMVSHGNLVFMERLIQGAFAQDESAVVAGWLPVYHDMGLIGNVLQPLYLGASCVLMSPVSFLRRPRRWLEAVSRYRATTSGGPNFAYELCVRRIGEEEREGLDLSSWRVAFNGAEPVRAATLERFAAAFAGCGFRREAFQPCYGLAEATLLVSGTRPAGGGPGILRVDAAALAQGRAEPEDGPRSRTLVSCGLVPDEVRVRVVDPEALRPRGSGEVGEIWVAGPGVALGYWQRPEATRESFAATLPGEEGRWLRTGDLGFLQGGELFVTGRLKDLVILRGRNHYPQDLELTVEASAPGLVSGGGAAFPVEAGGEERLVVAQEIEPRAVAGLDVEATAAAIRRAVAGEHEVQVYEVALLRPGALPKTTSGKVQRQACRRLWLDGALETVGRSRLTESETPAGEPGTALDAARLAAMNPEDRRIVLEDWLRQRIAAVLRVPLREVTPERPLLDLGLDSLAAMELAQAVEAEAGLPLPLSKVLEGASAADLADLLLSTRGTPAAAAPPSDLPVLSYGERGLWFLAQLAPADTAYFMAGAARLSGDVPTPVLRAAFQTLVDRHEALRTTFGTHDGIPVRRVAPRLEVPLEEIDATGWDEAGFARRLEEEAWRPFDLEHGPLLRVVVWNRPGGGRVLLFVIHHIISDFLSQALIVRELEDLLAGRGGAPAAAPRVSDFARWQADRLAGAEGERLWAYWRQRLAGLPALDLPLDRPGPARHGEPAVTSRLALGPELSERLRALARQCGVTLYALLLTAFQTLLHRLSGQTDLAVGSPAAGRASDLPGAGRTLGYLVNPLVLRADLSGESGFDELLSRTRRGLLEALDHQDFPLLLLSERLGERLGAGRGSHQLFRAMFVFHRPPAGYEGLSSFSLGEAGGRLRLGPLEVESLPLSPRSAQFDLTLTIAEGTRGLSMALTFPESLFDRTTGSRWLAQLATLLAGVAADPGCTVAALPLLPEPERHQVLVEGNDTAASPAPWVTLAEAFQEQARRTPEETALVWGGLRLSYAELDRRANRLAHRLRALGAGPERVVGVCLPRTAELVTALLAVLKAGAAYLPLDPGYPAERLAMLVQDAGALLRITGEGGPDLPGTALRLDGDDAGLAGEPGTAPAPLAGPRNLAYLIYTSGSTGKPKAVAIEHASAVRMVAWAGEVFTPTELSGVLASTSIGFDLSVFELFVPLSHGGTVILADNALALPALPAAGDVRLLNTVPSAAAALLDLGPLPPCLRTVNLAGEPLPRALADRLHAAGVARVLNLYGPSEDTTYSTFTVVEAGVRAPGIGRPLAGSQAYVLDRSLRPLPLGVPGELCLGGEGLARGYLGRPDLTAERFVPDPWTSGGRLYRTGDLTRRRPSGELEYLGRLDRQIKIRGFRIEPGEVEAALLSHPWVREAAVGAWQGDLVAWLAFTPDAPAGPEAVLRAKLAERLPPAFVPTAFVVLPALPLTPNGKVDRRALPAPERGQEDGHLPPRGPIEELLAAIWSDLLGVTAIGRDDSFFDLHGHSLLAARVTARVRQELGVDLPLTALLEEPRLSGFARRIEEARRGVLEPIPRAPRDRPLPLSFAQRRLWFLHRLDPDQAAYNLPVALDLHGGLDAAALERALEATVARHEALRTSFPEEEDGPVQRVAPPGPVPLPRVDLSALPPDAAGAEAGRIAHGAARRPFDLARGPVLRAALLRLGPGEHRLLVTVHHIVADHWSLGILLADVGSLYASPQTPLPEPALQYADYAAWEQARGVREDLLDWWRRRLAGAPPLELPTDRPRPALRSERGGSVPLDLPQAADLAALGRTHQATPFMALLAAFVVLLHRVTGQTDLTVGTAIAHRGRLELEGVVGMLVGTLALRHDVAGAGSWAALLPEVRRGTLDAYLRQDIPFERLVEELQPHRDLSRQAFLDVMFVLQNAPFPVPRIPGLAVAARPVETGTAQFDLSLTLTETGRGVEGTLEYAAELFDATTAQRLAEHYRALVAGILREPGAPLAELPLLGAAERHQLLVEWSDAPAPSSETDPLRPFLAWAERAPDAVALQAGELHLSYGELRARALRLAGHLRRRGVGPEVTVAVVGRRAPEMVTAMLSVLAAGGAFVPVDPAWPEERRALVLEDARSHLTLSWEPALEDPDLALDALDTLDGGHPAYILYTSGSTGRPKGVVGRRGALAPFIAGVGELYGLRPGDRLLQFSSLVFDPAMEEILATLTRGATLVLRDDAMIGASRGFFAACERLQITVLDIPTAFFHELAADLESELAVPPAVRLVAFGGERLRPAALDAWRRAAAGLRLINFYGPTETTISATGREAGTGTAEVSIGRPLFGAAGRVLSRELVPVPIGVAGELCLGGPGLTRGYLGRPDLTAERFVPDPWGAPGERLYRTGDLARTLPDGQIEFLGRVDQQVKVRGHRIEPGEIEAILAAHPGVRAAVVAARPVGDAGDPRLVAWVVPADPDLRPADLLGFLRARLPEVMVPSRFLLLPELPMTVSDKVDRGRLPDPPAEEEARGRAVHGDPVREIVAGIWAEVLGREDIGPDDDFFVLGGHSLLATRVASRLRRAFGVDLPLLSLFEAPTVATLARRIASLQRQDEEPPPRSLGIVGRVGELPLSPSQERLWFLDRLRGGSSSFYNLAGGLRLRGALDPAALERALREAARRHGALRTTFRQTPGEDPVQVVAAEPRVHLARVDLTTLPEAAAGDEARRVAVEIARHPFDLETGPLLRAALVRLAEGERDSLLVLCLHHIVGDAWSLTLLTDEVAAAYSATVHGGAPLPLQLGDFAVWQRRRQETEAYQERLAYWRRRLAGLPTLALPTDRPRPEIQTFHGDLVPFALPADLTADLRALARRRNATLFMVLFAAFAALLHRLTGQTDLAVGTDVANRDRVESEDVIGFFVNSLVLRTDASGQPTFTELLERVRRQTLEDYARQDVPFHKVVEALRPARDPSRNPLFQVMFILQNAPPPRLDLTALTAEPMELGEASSVFDLSLSLAEDGARGLQGTARYNIDLFEAATIRRLVERYGAVLRQVAARPEARLDTLEVESAAEREQRMQQTTKRKDSKFGKLAAAQPRAVRLSQEELVRATPLLGAPEDGRPPLLVEPAHEGVDLEAWGRAHRARIEEWLDRWGGVLFRGFEVGSLARFQAVVAAVASRLLRYGERSSPRSLIEGEVYTSTDHPEDQPIVLHNEQSYTLSWPMRIAFFCVQPALTGGRTPLADSRRVLARLSPAVREAFERRGVLYVRNYGDGLGLPWREVFQTTDRAEVERYCRAAGLELQWKDGDRLRTRQVRPAIRRHPRTGEPVWFNHALFFHVSSLEPATRDALLAGLAPEDLPFNTFYGDGAPIAPETLAELRAAYDAETVSFPWQKDDVLLLDNMLVAHGREPFTGPRRIAVAMADPADPAITGGE